MLEKLAENHTLWIKMLINMGCDYVTAQDLTQEMYLRMHRLIVDQNKIMYNDEEVNRFFVYVVLRNMYSDYMKAKNKFTTFEYLETDSVEHQAEDDSLQEMADFDHTDGLEAISRAINKEISGWRRYDAMLANMYFKGNLSLRDIANGSGISLTSIFNSVKKYKQKIRHLLVEDYEDYINGDWHLIDKFKTKDNGEDK
jgi:DNA-directed RNA polymerase specialized sigma24 family protein